VQESAFLATIDTPRLTRKKHPGQFSCRFVVVDGIAPRIARAARRPRSHLPLALLVARAVCCLRCLLLALPFTWRPVTCCPSPPTRPPDAPRPQPSRATAVPPSRAAVGRRPPPLPALAHPSSSRSRSSALSNRRNYRSDLRPVLLSRGLALLNGCGYGAVLRLVVLSRGLGLLNGCDYRSDLRPVLLSRGLGLPNGLDHRANPRPGPSRTVAGHVAAAPGRARRDRP
jgi:hypothetical protein